MKSEATAHISKRLLVFCHDIFWVPVAILAAYWLRLNLGPIPKNMFPGVIEVVLVAILMHATTFRIFGCYRGIWRFASIPDLLRLFKAVLLGAVATIILCFMIGRLQTIPRSVLVLYPMLLIGVLSTARIMYRAFKDRHFKLDIENRPRALLVGAGRAGEMLVRDMERHPQLSPVAFVDDDSAKLGQEVRGVRIRGSINDIPRLLEDLAVEVVLITMPSAPHKVLDRVVKMCAEHGIKCRTLPSLTELADGRIEIARLRPVTVEDLLGRDPVELDPGYVAKFLEGKRVLVTGGGGSIGSELCRQIGRHKPGTLTVLDNSEYNLYRIDQELSTGYPALIFNSVLGDVRNEQFMDNVFHQCQPEVVFHAAAYKHVPIMEDNIIQGICNNVFGTQVVADAAKRYAVGTFVLISTDKTVNPTNVMGATKRVAELYCQTLNESSHTHFLTTRFGNVLGSAGSVVPLFERQIAAGGPVTVTHPEVTRYFMTIPEAASLILQAGAIGKGGEIFVLDMGEPVRISDLAVQMIQLSGLQPERDIEIVYIGLRPGEKLHEELFYNREELRKTVHPKLLLASCTTASQQMIFAGLKKLNEVSAAYDNERALYELKSLVPEFNPSLTWEERTLHQTRTHLQIVK
ncbi:MAG TPA: nucleoside-diphosphate sugar epimerase/dehydratase [Gammaproteobacteria bacterium]|nr:nucleoside-diphosphate sugar epimerase/dehydratase [Gammaproteobacteria bacterium]